MALEFCEGFGWSDFANSTYKWTAGVGFFGGGSGTLTGSIQPGPFAGTFGKLFQIANGSPDFFGNTGWFQSVDLGSGRDVWIVSMWIKPSSITSRQSFFALTNNLGVAALVLNINAALKLEMNAQHVQTRMNQNVGTYSATSQATFPDGQWNHICVRLVSLGGSNGRVQLWVNGSLDTDNQGLNLSFAPAASQAGLVWQTTGGPSIEISQVFVCDTTGSVNNTNVSPNTRIKTIFANADVANGSWVPLVAGPNYAMLNSAAGPSNAAYVSLSSLTFADELLGMPPLSTDDQNLALVLNICTQRVGAATLQALMKQGATKHLLGPVLTPPVSALTFQAIAETNPATGLAWKDADISADAFGFRGLTGTGELVEQFFLEKVLTSGLGSYSY